MNALQQYLHRHVDVLRFYTEELQDFHAGQNVPCVFHKDTQASLSIETDKTGAYYCHGCGAKGTSFVGFYVATHEVPYDLALRELYQKYVRPEIPITEVLDNHNMLMGIPGLIEWIVTHRGVVLDTLKYYKIGYDGHRVTIPIENEFEMIVNMRRYDVTKKADAKMISYAKGYGGACLFPSNNLSKPSLVVVEGEWDAILANQLGIPAICSTGGAGSWLVEFSELLAGKDVTVIMDNDDAGRRATDMIVARLEKYAAVVRATSYNVEGMDLTDYILGGGNPDALKAKIRGAPVISMTASASQDKMFTKIRLQEATNPKYRGRPVEFKAHVIGKDTQPYYVTKKYRTTCLTRPDHRCVACRGTEPYTSIREVELWDEKVLGMISTAETRLHTTLKGLAGCKKGCDVHIESLETVCCEEVKLVAPLDEVAIDEDFKYVVRIGYVINVEVGANETYIFRGYPYPDPDTQHVVFLLFEAIPAADQLDHFQLTADDVKVLKDQFPGGSDAQQIHTFLDELYSYLAVTVTKIYERRALHQAVDLVFHSALGFQFNGEYIKRGWLDVLIIGDTRTGKGYVTERLSRYFGAGEVASGENCTFSGLVGGVQQIGSRKSWVVTWGFLPRNDRRLGIIDEAGSVASDTLSRMSRVRSEGIAEVFKIVTERTMARTRIIWNANPTDGRAIREFEYGIESVMTLTEKKEDVARFDYAVVVSSDEIDPAIINSARPDVSMERENLQTSCRKLIQWAWSRRPSDIIFEPKAVKIILDSSTVLGKEYHPSIPLIQIENIRIKLAKISVAVAARVFSTDDDGMKIVVTPACAEYAVGFLKYIYTQDTSAYDIYSSLKREQNNLSSYDELEVLFATYKDRGRAWCNSLLDSNRVNTKMIEANLGLDFHGAKEVRNKLVELRAIRAEHSYWVKREPFILFLRQLRARYTKDPRWWEEI